MVKFLKLAKPEIKLKFSSSEHSGLVLKGYMWLQWKCVQEKFYICYRVWQICPWLQLDRVRNVVETAVYRILCNILKNMLISVSSLFHFYHHISGQPAQLPRKLCLCILRSLQHKIFPFWFERSLCTAQHDVCQGKVIFSLQIW